MTRRDIAKVPSASTEPLAQLSREKTQRPTSTTTSAKLLAPSSRLRTFSRGNNVALMIVPPSSCRYSAQSDPTVWSGASGFLTRIALF